MKGARSTAARHERGPPSRPLNVAIRESAQSATRLGRTALAGIFARSQRSPGADAKLLNRAHSPPTSGGSARTMRKQPGFVMKNGLKRASSARTAGGSNLVAPLCSAALLLGCSAGIPDDAPPRGSDLAPPVSASPVETSAPPAASSAAMSAPRGIEPIDLASWADASRSPSRRIALPVLNASLRAADALSRRSSCPRARKGKPTRIYRRRRCRRTTA
jgi:hypothetical protein